MALEMLLADKAEVKVLLEIPAQETKYDDLIDGIIAGVSNTFQEVAGRGTEEKDRTEYFDCEEFTQYLYLFGWPINAPADLNLYYDADRAWGAETEVDTADYYIDYNKGVIELLKPFAVGTKVFKITYTGGMAEDLENFQALYPDVAEAVVAQTVFDYKSIPNLGINLVRLRQDQIQINKPISRIPLFNQTILVHSRMIL